MSVWKSVVVAGSGARNQLESIHPVESLSLCNTLIAIISTAQPKTSWVGNNRTYRVTAPIENNDSSHRGSLESYPAPNLEIASVVPKTQKQPQPSQPVPPPQQTAKPNHDAKELHMFVCSSSASPVSKAGSLHMFNEQSVRSPRRKKRAWIGDIIKIHFVLLISRQGKVRLTKWYSPYAQKERTKVIRELSGMILTRGPKLCNFVEWRGFKVVYKRYASLYFCMCIDQEDNELEILEIIHHYVEILDRYFGSAYYILDELLIAGELQESSKKTVARLIAAQDSLVEAAKEQASSLSNMIAQATK
nr:AP-1 complex subunit sigma-1 [Ipomoea batatas]